MEPAGPQNQTPPEAPAPAAVQPQPSYDLDEIWRTVFEEAEDIKGSFNLFFQLMISHDSASFNIFFPRAIQE